jgi:hypothetical protein
MLRRRQGRFDLAIDITKAFSEAGDTYIAGAGAAFALASRFATTLPDTRSDLCLRSVLAQG